MPTGLFVRRLEENQFKPETSEKYIDSYVWMDYIMKSQKIKIMHKLNHTREVRIGSYLVDGYCVENKTVYEFNGCYYHHCKYNCYIINQIKNQSWIQKIKKVSERDEKKKQFLLSQVHKYISIQECEFIRNIKRKCSKIYEKYLPSYYRSHKGALSVKNIISDIKKGKLFGVVEVDIQVEKDKLKYFQEFPPFFATCNVHMKDIGLHMQEYCLNQDMQFDFKRLLISGLQASKILLATPLLKWYLNNHCQIKKNYQIIEYQPETAFKSFIDKVTYHRIEGDRNPDKAVIGDTYKLLSNSSYGSILMDKSKHTTIRYIADKIKVTKIINTNTFKTLDELSNSTYEVESYKSRIRLDNPIQIGFFILQYAKLRMLEFYYDCLSKYLEENSFELTETDTDSLYMALNRTKIDHCIKTSYKQKYNNEIYNSCSDDLNPVWFPRRCCNHHRAVDFRFVGCYKKEWEGTKMISLCSKSYIIEDAEGKQKISCKGISKKNLINPMEKFEKSIHNQVNAVSTNIGFRIKNSSLYTYSQERLGFNYFYCKRQVLSDGVSTKPLDIILTPWNQQHVVIDSIHNPMSNLYTCQIRLDELTFHSSEQLFNYLISNSLKYKELAQDILNCQDPLEIQTRMKELNVNQTDIERMERIMRFTVLQKFLQSHKPVT